MPPNSTSHEASSAYANERGILCALIPAYRPDRQLVDLVRELVRADRFASVIVVDDGSGPEFLDLFAELAAVSSVVLLRHAVNLGKGAALKTGMNRALLDHADLVGTVTADADGQHVVADIIKVSESLRRHPNQLVLGCRSFRRDIPFKSFFGNVLTRAVFTALVGRRVSDTQTGLRGIPAFLMKELLSVRSNRYEFEMDMLMITAKYQQPFVEEEIKTIYFARNQATHFNPILDSARIYFSILRFALSSATSYLVELVLFAAMFAMSGSVLTSQVFSRVSSAFINYFLVRDFVFHSTRKRLSPALSYALVVVFSGSLSYLAQIAILAEFAIHPIYVKILVETVIFFVNFAVLRSYVFTRRIDETQSD